MLTESQIEIAAEAAAALDDLVIELERLTKQGLLDTKNELVEYMTNLSNRGICTYGDDE